MSSRSLLALCLVACSPGGVATVLGENHAASTSVASATAPAGASSSDSSRFFPIGLFHDAGVRSVGQTATWPYDPALFFEETFREVKSWGINTVVPTGLENPVAGVFLDTAASVGGLNVVLAGENLGWYGNQNGGNICVNVWDDGQAQSSALAATRMFAHYPALLAWAIMDEPGSCALPSLRWVRSWLDVYDPSHDGFTANYAENVNHWGSWASEDAQLGDGVFVHDEYPVGLVAATDPMAYVDPIGKRSWESDLEKMWRTTPLDKPWWQVVQAFSAPGWWRVPDRIEERYLTYSSLARGAKGIYFFMNSIPDASQGTGFADPEGNFYEGGGAIVPALAHELAAVSPFLVDATRDDARTGRPLGGQGCGAVDPTYTIAYVGGGRAEADCDLFSFTRASQEKVFVLVNKHRTQQVFDLFLNKAWLPQTVGTPALIDPVSGTTYALHDEGSTWELLLPVAAGNGAVLRLVPPMAATIEPFKDVIVHAVAPGKPVRVRVAITNSGTTTWDPAQVAVGVKLYPDGGVPVIATGVYGTDLGGAVAPGDQIAAVLTIPTGQGTQVATNGTWRVGVDLVAGGTAWFGNELQITTFVHDEPMLVDTFDQPPYKHPADFLSKWDRAPLATIREGTLALDGHGATMSHLGDAWTDYTVEFDVKVDEGSQRAGWVVRGDSRNGGNGTAFRIRAGSSGDLERFSLVNGQVTLTEITALPRQVLAGQWVHVKEVVTGTVIVLFLDGMLARTTTANAATGKIGFYANERNGDRMHVDNVIVYRDGVSPPAPAPVTLAFAPVPYGIQLTWSASVEPASGAAVANYVIYRSDTPGGPYAQVGMRTGTIYRAYGTPAGTGYWVVAAVSANDVTSPLSNEVAGAPPVPVAAPGPLSATASSSRTVALAWPKAGGAVDHYDVFRVRGGSPPGAWTEAARIASPTGNAWEDTARALYASDQQEDPRPFGTYTYAVQAVDSYGQVSDLQTATITLPGSAIASDGFDGNHLMGWWTTPHGGVYAVGGSILQQRSNSLCGIGPTLTAQRTLDDARVGDFVVEAQVRIDDTGGDDLNWTGFGVRQRVATDDIWNSGYLIYLRATGQVNLYTPARGTLVSAQAATTPTGAFRQLRAEVRGAHFLIFIDGVKLIDYVDPAPPAGSDTGYVGLASCGIKASYDSFNLSYREPFEDLAGLQIAGQGSIAFGQLVLSGYSTATPHRTWVRDFTADFDVKIDSDTNNGFGWAGFTFRKQLETDRFWQSGYLLYYRSNGLLELYRAGAVIAVVNTGLPPTTSAQRVRVVARGGAIRAYVNGVLEIDVVDSTYATGYVDLNEDSTTSRFSALSIY